MLRFENFFCEGFGISFIWLGLEGVFWEINVFLWDLEFVGFKIFEVDFLLDDIFSIVLEVSFCVLIEFFWIIFVEVLLVNIEIILKWCNLFICLCFICIEVDGKYYWVFNVIYFLIGILFINGIDIVIIDGWDFVEGEVLGGRKIMWIELNWVWFFDDFCSFVLEFMFFFNLG